MNRKTRRAQSARIVEQAERHVGYHAQPSKRNAYSPKRYDGKDWNGVFVDRVLHDAFEADPEVSFVSTVTALGFYAAKNGLYRKPRAGDVVFLNFATDPQEWDHQPHVGIVTEVRPDGAFRTVEGQTLSGKPQGLQLADGVHERLRFPTDVLAFVRPAARTVPHREMEPPTVKMSYFDSNGKTVARAVETLQTALGIVRPGWMGGKHGIFNRGKRDGVFKSAFGRYNRETGAVENRGEITQVTVLGLANEGGFNLEP